MLFLTLVRENKSLKNNTVLDLSTVSKMFPSLKHGLAFLRLILLLDFIHIQLNLA